MPTGNSGVFMFDSFRWARRLVAAVLLLVAGTAAAQMDIRTFDLHNRSAEEMIPLIRPLADPGAAVTGTGYTLIVRSSPENLNAIADTILELDTAPERLMITVRQGGGTGDEGRGYGLSGRAGSGEDRARVRVYQSERETERASVQRLTVLEGHWARIRVGQEVPFIRQMIVEQGNHAEVRTGVDYRDVTTGFEVRPRVSGASVTLEIRPFSARVSPRGGGMIDVEEISTTVAGPIGQWIPLGGVSEESSRRGSGIVYSTRRESNREHQVYLKVERQ